MNAHPRLRWLDLLRSAAILGMIVYHAAFDLQWYHGWAMDVTVGAWHIFQVCVASLFLGISGIAAGFWTRKNAFSKGWRRGITILIAALFVSLATAIADPTVWIRFGILHCIALAAFILPILRRLHPAIIAGLGVACIALGPLLYPPPFYTLDYVPPFPWLGPAFIGFAIGIPLSQRSWSAPKPSRTLDALTWPGRHSLGIYLVHQPILLVILWLALPHP